MTQKTSAFDRFAVPCNPLLSIEPDARDALGGMLGEDRLSTRMELDKLTLYSRGGNTITIADINEILHDASALSVDAAMIAIFSGQSRQAVESINKALQSGVDINMLIAAAQRHALALHKSRSEIENAAPFDSGLQILLRLIYGYGRKAEVAALLRNTSLGKTEQAVQALAEIGKTTRKSSALE